MYTVWYPLYKSKPLTATQAVGQICSTADPLHNLAQCQQLVSKAASGGAKVLFLPEAADYVASSPEQSKSLCKSAAESVFVKGLQDAARQHKLPINVGIHEPCEDSTNGKMRNSLIYIDENGDIAQRYIKLHLFNMDLSSQGGPSMHEADTIEPGNKILPPFDTPIGKVGLAMCFDLRFPQLALSHRRQGAEIITYPSAFADHTGRMHWHPLLRARAIENEAYVIAAAQVGAHSEKRSSYGHAMIIDPWGEILVELGGTEDKDAKGDKWEPEVAFADIDLKKVETMRQEIILERRTQVTYQSIICGRTDNSL